MEEHKGNKIKNIIFYTIIASIISISSIALILNNNSSEAKNINSNIENKNQITSNKNKEDEVYKATINVSGDLMFHMPILNSIVDKSSNTYSFDNIFKYVKPYTEKADIAMANLETTFAGDSIPYSSYPSFNTPDTLADTLKSSGFDMLSTINNHSFDKGNLGFFRTLEVLKSKNIDTIGSKKSLEDKNYIIKTVNNIELGITAFSYGDIENNEKFLNGIKLSDKAKDNANIFSSTDPQEAFNTIDKTLKNLDSTDMQIVFIHWGEEYQREANSFQKELAQLLCNRGVDIIVGAHPHVVQPVEMIKSQDNTNETLVIYSLGNLISNQRREYLKTPYTEDGLMINIEISKENNKTFVSKALCIPTWVNKYYNNGKHVYEIVPLSDKKLLSTMTNLSKSRAEESYNNTYEQIKQSEIIKITPNPFK